MRRVFVPLDEREIADLVVLARNQRRRPQDQAALWIAERLRAEKSVELNPAAERAASR